MHWIEIQSIQLSPTEALLEKYNSVFRETLGTIQNVKAHVYVEPTTKPRYCKAQPIPYSIRTKVKEELDWLIADRTLEPVQMLEWAAPIVSVIKPDKKSICISGDFQQTVNPVAKLDKYSIPK